MLFLVIIEGVMNLARCREKVRKYDLVIEGGSMDEIDSTYADMSKLKDIIEKELRLFQDSDNDRIEIVVEK